VLKADEDIGLMRVVDEAVLGYITRRVVGQRKAEEECYVMCPRQQKAEEEKDGGCNSKKIIGSRNQEYSRIKPARDEQNQTPANDAMNGTWLLSNLGDMKFHGVETVFDTKLYRTILLSDSITINESSPLSPNTIRIQLCQYKGTLFKARKDDERHQESRQDWPDQIMHQQVGAIPLFKAREDDERHQEILQDRPDQIMLQQYAYEKKALKHKRICDLSQLNGLLPKSLCIDSCYFEEENETEKGHDKWGFDQGYSEDGTMQVRDSKTLKLSNRSCKYYAFISPSGIWGVLHRFVLVFVKAAKQSGGESSVGIGSQGQFKGGVGNSNERAEAAPAVVAPVKSGKSIPETKCSKINIEEEVEER
ncbi:hypothetical protein Tco_1094855, partial [Tanacetum coccineum]